MMSRKKIVIIDDEEDLCHLMKTYFLELNHDVFLANTLSSGLLLIEKVSPDVVFIDNNLPDGLGWEKMNYLMEQYPDCKINLISAYDYLPPDLKNRKNNTVKILEKPLRLNTLKDYL
jgi:two-component system OmpR family response regulator